MTRQNLLNARREEWDRWAESTGAMRRARKVLLDIMEDPEVNARERLTAVRMLEERGLGKTTEARELPPVQPLMILMPKPDGGYLRLDSGAVVDAEFEPVTDGDGD